MFLPHMRMPKLMRQTWSPMPQQIAVEVESGEATGVAAAMQTPKSMHLK